MVGTEIRLQKISIMKNDDIDAKKKRYLHLLQEREDVPKHDSSGRRLQLTRELERELLFCTWGE